MAYKKPYSRRKNRNNFSRNKGRSNDNKKTSGGGYAARGRKRYYKRGNFGRSRPRSEKLNHALYVSQVSEDQQNALLSSGQTFNDFSLQEKLKTNIAKQEFVQTTKIQSQTIPHILNGRDILAIAHTGSGKTAAFLIPLLNKALQDPSQKCIVITPTRELAGQIQNEMYKFGDNTGIRSVLVIGGANMYKQKGLLKKSPQFVICTPGRLKDLSQRKAIDLNQFNVVVLDEVDRMLDMGFLTDIKDIISRLRKHRQSLFFSATMPKESEKIAATLLYNPVRVDDMQEVAHKNVDQNIVKVGSQNKVELLHGLLSKEDFEKVLIFTRTRRGADKLSSELNSKGHKTDAIHGLKRQTRRAKTLSAFKKNDIRILIATDVASRGIDVPDISHVINYDEPSTKDDYIHRIGRTGRLGRKGIALTFVS